MKDIQEFSLVVSNKGHDRGCYYLVLKINNNIAYCVNGDNRTIDNPKKKRLKHLLNTSKIFKEIAGKFENKKLYDFEVKTIIKKEVKLHKV